MVDARRGADVLLEAPADRLLDVLRAQAGRQRPDDEHRRRELGERVDAIRGVTTPAKTTSPTQSIRIAIGLRSDERGHGVVSAPRGVGAAALARPVANGTSLAATRSPSARIARPSVTTSVPGLSAVSTNRSLPCSPCDGERSPCAPRPHRRRRQVALDPVIEAATSGTAVAGDRLRRPRSRTSPVVFTGISRVGVGQIDLDVHRARLGVGARRAPRDRPGDRPVGREDVDRDAACPGRRRRSRSPGRRTSSARWCGRRPRRWRCPGRTNAPGSIVRVADLAVERRAQDAVADLEAGRRELRPLRRELRLLATRSGPASAPPRSATRSRRRGGVWSARRLVGERLLPRVDGARLGGDGLARRARVAAIERGEHLAALGRRRPGERAPCRRRPR